LFRKKDSKPETNDTDRSLPVRYESPILRIQQAFKGDENAAEPIVRLTRYFRERFGVSRGDYLVLKKGSQYARARVEVSSSEDGVDSIARLNPKARELLNARVGEDIEILPHETMILLIDTSGSMADFISGTVKMEAAKTALREFIRSKFLMRQNDRVGIASFGEHASMVEPPSVRYEHLEHRSASLTPSGATAMYEGLRLCIDNLSPMGGAKRVVLLTDGVPTTTGKLSIINLAREAAEKKIVIDTVGVGSPFDFMGYDEQLLRRIAAITGGTFRRVLDVQQLSSQFRELAEGKNYTYLLPES
jgi:Mg-chelatase subunit ChlD